MLAAASGDANTRDGALTFVKTFVAYKPSCAAGRLVTFSNGTHVDVPAHTLVAYRNDAVISSALLGRASCNTAALVGTVVDTTSGTRD